MQTDRATLAQAELGARIAAAVAGQPRDYHQQLVARGAAGGLWDLWQGLEELAALHARWDARQAPRAPTPRGALRPWQETGRYVGRVSLDPVTHLRTCALRVLLLVRSLAGQGARLETLTASLATQLGYTRRAVQYAYHELRAHGYLTHAYDRRRGLVVLELQAAALPPAIEAAAEPRQRRAPVPSQGWRQAFARRVQQLQQVAARGVRNGVRALTLEDYPRGAAQGAKTGLARYAGQGRRQPETA